MKVAILISDGGDGYASLLWFKDVKFAADIADRYDQFNINEGVEVVEVQEDFNPPGGFSDEEWKEDEE